MKKNKLFKITCEVCQTVFYVVKVRKNTAKFCSHSCNGKKNGSKNLLVFEKENIPWNKGKSGVQDTSHLIGENNYQWKGENVSYRELHKWVENHLGKPRICTFCRSTEEKKYDWANISGDYHRDLEDWIRLCRSCHIRYDRSNK